MDTIKQSSGVVFLLGAGASVTAGVPDTYSFVKRFMTSVSDNYKKEMARKIIKILEEWKGSKIDIELLLETLEKLEKKEQEPLLQFYQDGHFILEGYPKKGSLIADLKDFIKSKATVPENRLGYLKPLFGFVKDYTPLDIISVNYDTCIENWCYAHKLNYQDGFDVHWNPETFNADLTHIRLYKLHGSVLWYQSDRGDYLKLPILTEKGRITLITGEKAENLILYPTQKLDYAEPLLELLVIIKRFLELPHCRVLVVIGYSFRDNPIRRIIWDAARKNRDLILVLIDPKAYRIYTDKLQYYDEERKNQSSLYGRVVCLPYRFEKVFPHLKNHYIRKLQEAKVLEQQEQENEQKGYKGFWNKPITPYADSDWAEKTEELLKKIDTDAIAENWQLKPEILLKITVANILLGQKRKTTTYSKEFRKLMGKMLIEGCCLQVMKTPQVVEVSFKPPFDTKISNRIVTTNLEGFISTLLAYCEMRDNLIGHTCSELSKYINMLKRLKEFLGGFGNGRIEIEDYILTKKSKMKEIDRIVTVYEDYKRNPLEEKCKNVELTIREIIRKEVESIIGE